MTDNAVTDTDQDTNETDRNSTDWERINEDPSAEPGDTRIRVEPGEHGTYELRREEYELVEFESNTMADDGHGFERYDWHVEDRFILHGNSEAEQFTQMLRKEGAFDPNVLFFRQRERRTQQSGNSETDQEER